jgi:hypothetical protein
LAEKHNVQIDQMSGTDRNGRQWAQQGRSKSRSSQAARTMAAAPAVAIGPLQASPRMGLKLRFPKRRAMCG